MGIAYPHVRVPGYLPEGQAPSGRCAGQVDREHIHHKRSW